MAEIVEDVVLGVGREAVHDGVVAIQDVLADSRVAGGQAYVDVVGQLRQCMHAHGSADFEHDDRILRKRVDRDRLLAGQRVAWGHRYLNRVGLKLDELDVFGDFGEELVDKLRDKQDTAGVLVVSDLADDFLAVFLGREDGHVRVV